MTMTATTPINSYTGNGATVVFTYGFRIIAEADLKVYFDGIAQGSGFSVSDVGSSSGGDVTFTSAPADGVVVRLERVTTIDRTTDYAPGGGLASNTLDEDFDRPVGMIQELDRRAIQETSDGKIDVGSRILKNLATPTEDTHAATKLYSDTNLAQVAADLVLTNADVVLTHADVVLTNADVVTTNADVVLTNAKYLEFDQRYLGEKASDPTLDNQGAALLTGALYWNTSGLGLQIYGGSTWYDPQDPTGDIIPSVTTTYDLGSASLKYSNVFATTFQGEATAAQYADLAEMYSTAVIILPATVVSFGGTAEVEISKLDMDTRVAGVVSTHPAHLMNCDAVGVAVALTGRVPCIVSGSIKKGDLLVSNGNGGVRAEANPVQGSVVGKAIADSEGDAIIEVAVGRF